MMRIVAWRDVTLPLIATMPRYPGDPEVVVERIASLAAGDVCNLSRAGLGLHTGTHIDAPVHFLEGGAGIEATPLAALIGPAWVVDATATAGPLDADLLETVPSEARRILFRGRNSALWATPARATEYAPLSERCARALVARGVLLAGIDALSVAPLTDPAPVHRILLAAGVVIVEGLDLREVAAGWHDLICLPLLVPGGDGAPARVVLREAAAAGE